MKNDKPIHEDDDAVIIEFPGDDGSILYYEQEMILPVGGERYAVLVALPEDSDEEAEDDAIIAKIVPDENGEDLYIDPTEEEFARAEEAYNALLDEEEAD